MAQKIFLHIRKGSEEDIREALDDILSSGLVEKITDEKGSPVSLEVRTAEAAAEPVPAVSAGKSAARAPSVRKTVLAQKSTVVNGIECVTAMMQAARGEDETCMGQRVTLTDRGGGEEELTRQRYRALLDMNQPRVFLMELPGRAIVEGSACGWYPLDGTDRGLSS